MNRTSSPAVAGATNVVAGVRVAVSHCAVVEVGANVNATYGSLGHRRPRVQVIAAVPCGECRGCRKGWMAVCANQTSVGYQYDGGFAEYMIVPRQVFKADGLNRIPDNVGWDEGVEGSRWTTCWTPSPSWRTASPELPGTGRLSARRDGPHQTQG